MREHGGFYASHREHGGTEFFRTQRRANARMENTERRQVAEEKEEKEKEEKEKGREGEGKKGVSFVTDEVRIV